MHIAHPPARAIAALTALALLALLHPACGDGGDDDADTTAVDTAAPDSEADASEDASADADAAPDTDADGPAGPGTLADEGFTEVRVIAHLHSAFSHDGCDEAGLDDEGLPNWPCVRRMKASLCRERIGVAFMTDHPSHMRTQPFEALLYAEPDAGDELLRESPEAPAWGVRYACPDGEGGPDGAVTLVPGFEGTHTMPLGIRRHLDPTSLYSVSFKTDTPSDDLARVTAEVEDAGGMVAIAHSEQTDLDAATIAAHDVAAMEVYNFHANFNVVLGDNIATALLELEAFLDPTAPIPSPDLVALVMLESYPTPALDKWRAVSLARPITAIAGSDVHENVHFPAICADPGVCDSLAIEFPNMAAALAHGGPVMLADGDRLDSYSRVFRWVQNHVWVAPGEAPLVERVEDALRAGRNVVVFEVLGEAHGASLVALTAGDDGARHEVGSTLGLADDATLWARSPERPRPGSAAAWTDGASARVTARIVRTDDAGSEVVATWETFGAWREIPLDRPGSYHMEVTLQPEHLAGVLGPAAHLADGEYRWVLTNAIRVTE